MNTEEKDTLAYALAKQVPAMARGFTIQTSYGELRIDADDAAPFVRLASQMLEHKLDPHKAAPHGDGLGAMQLWPSPLLDLVMEFSCIDTLFSVIEEEMQHEPRTHSLAITGQRLAAHGSSLASRLFEQHERGKTMSNELDAHAERFPCATPRSGEVQHGQTPGLIVPPALNDGEKWAGIVLGENGGYHLILLPGDAASLNWSSAKAWAAEQGGELPTRREQSLLFANLKGEFESAGYWCAEKHERESGWAWSQYFSYGYQGYYGKHYELRARAVRRSPIQSFGHSLSTPVEVQS